MKFHFSPYALIASVVCSGMALLSACGGTATPPSNGANAKTVNTANSNAATNPNSNSTVATVSDKPPITTTADNLQLSADWMDATEFPGRTITVSGYINHASKDTLNVGYSYGSSVTGNGIECKGDFSQYPGIEDRVNGLAKSNKAPKATVKGTFTIREDKTMTLEPCVLVDIAK